MDRNGLTGWTPTERPPGIAAPHRNAPRLIAAGALVIGGLLRAALKSGGDGVENSASPVSASLRWPAGHALLHCERLDETAASGGVHP